MAKQFVRITLKKANKWKDIRLSEKKIARNVKKIAGPLTLTTRHYYSNLYLGFITNIYVDACSFWDNKRLSLQIVQIIKQQLQ